MSEVPGLITKVMNYGTMVPVSEIRLCAKCLECMGNIIKNVLFERKSLYQTTKVSVRRFFSQFGYGQGLELCSLTYN
jgi:hypothetical protein